jgi:hypothetical protein
MVSRKNEESPEMKNEPAQNYSSFFGAIPVRTQQNVRRGKMCVQKVKKLIT